MNKLAWKVMTPFGLSLALFSFSEKQPASEKLNVLFISVDDLRPELNCYGNQQVISPNIDRLAQNGVLFERAYCQQAICMATRASIFTGIYPASNRIYTFRPVHSLMPDALTLNQHFANAGYEVIGMGKLYHYDEDNRKQFGKSWSDNRTWDGYLGKGRGYVTPEVHAQLSDNEKGPAWEIADVEDNAYLDGFYADRVIEMLSERKESSKPFFIGVGFRKPHLPFNAPKKYWDLYDPSEITTADNPFYPKNGSEYGWHNSNELRTYSNIPKGENPIPEDIEKMLIRGYRACVSYTDAQIGRILDALDASGLSENTVIILWGDHGWKLGEHGMWNKHTNFEPDTRVPMIIAAPGMKRDVKTSSFAEYVDIYPTLADLCGLKVPEHLHGKSLVPVLSNPEYQFKDHAFSIWPSYKGNRTDKEKVILGYSVRTEKYRYTEWIHVDSGKQLDRELYDHTRDHDEFENVISDAKYAADLPALELLIQHYRDHYQN